MRKSEKKGVFMYTILFIISLVLFGYLMYVLVNPEKF
ncbi:MAG: K(+)-transporting ATPase subunit F [Tannerella sp.]|nr:K(+)-transporting ATPase subunit F [Tannerella sp.]